MIKHPLRKFLACGACLCSILFLSQASWAAPRIEFNQTETDMGEVIQGKPAIYTFEFKNAGNEALVIKDVKAG